MKSWIRTEIKGFSRPFKILIACVAGIYILAWVATIYISHVQIARNIQPVLPVVPQDSEEYAWLSSSLLSGQGFSHDETLETLRAPGYPAFVAAASGFGWSLFAVTFIQMLLAFASALIVRRIGKAFWSQKVGEIAAILLLLNPVTLVLSLVMLTDILFLFLFTLGFYLAIVLNRSNAGSVSLKRILVRSFVIGLVFGAAIYVRPMGYFAIPIFAAGFLIPAMPMKARLAAIAVMLVTIGATLVPWMVRNYEETGVFGFTSFEGINLAYYAAPMFLAHEHGTTDAAERDAIQQTIGIPEADWRDIRYSKELSAVSKGIILKQPVSYAEYHLQSSLPFLFSSTLAYAVDKYDSAMNIAPSAADSAIHDLLARNWQAFGASISASWWKLAERVCWVILYLIALWGLILNRRRLFAWVCVFIPAYLMVLAGPAADARYALPALPFIAIPFAIGFLDLRPRLQKKLATLRAYKPSRL